MTIERTNYNDFFSQGGTEIKETRTIDDVEMKKNCIEIVKNYFEYEGLDVEYSLSGLERRAEIAYSFYYDIKKEMGIDAELVFTEMPNENMLGGYNPDTNEITLNMKYLENPDFKDLSETILHEARHAFQEYAVEHPEKVTVSDKVIDAWKENFDNYIQPCYDFEAYENQEIEKDANYYATTVMDKGTDLNYYIG